MDGITDHQPSPENLRQHKGDQSSFNVSHNEDVVREPEEETETESTLLHALNQENQEPISEEAR